MSELEAYSDEDIELLAGLLYRAGIWVSHADDVDGELDDEKEIKALQGCIRAVARKYDGPGLVDDIARETLSRQSSWPVWADNAFNILPDCEKAMALLHSQAGEQDAKNYRAAMLEIATTVAQAYGEFGAFDDWEDEQGAFSAFVGKIVGGFSGLSKDDEDHPMNISAAEDSAIAQLSAALKTE